MLDQIERDLPPSSVEVLTEAKWTFITQQVLLFVHITVASTVVLNNVGSNSLIYQTVKPINTVYEASPQYRRIL